MCVHMGNSQCTEDVSGGIFSQIGVRLGGFAWLVGTVFLLYLLLSEPMDGKGVNAQLV